MPLRDHFHPPFTNKRSWDAVHGGWPMVIVQQLAKILPPRYYAGPQVHIGAEVEIDVATFDTQTQTAAEPSVFESNGGGAPTAVWAPAEPTLAVETDMSDFDEYEVRVYDEQRDRLVAAIELISPGNKDRPEARSQFTAKCAKLLRQGVSVALLDVVTERTANLYAELLDLINRTDTALSDPPPAIYAVACRWVPRGRGRWLETWYRDLTIGQALPCLPLWLAENLALPLDLESSYEQTCRDLRII